MVGESHGQRSLAGYSPWSCKESDTTEHKTRQTHFDCLFLRTVQPLTKRHAIAWKKIFVKHKSDKGLLPKICRELVIKQELVPYYVQKPILWHYLFRKEKSFIGGLALQGDRKLSNLCLIQDSG